MLLASNYDKWGGKKVQPIATNKIAYMVNPPEDHKFYSQLKEEISIGGMNDPICLVPVSSKRLDFLQHANADIFLKVQEYSFNENGETLMVVRGNNRILIAKELGYTSIDAVIMGVDDFVGVERTRKRFKKEPELNSERNNG